MIFPFWGRLVTRPPDLELGGGLIAEGRVATLPIIEHF
ncbi:MAG: hypothetical protein OJF51_000289 [Nitrospira sp.]|nr:MAG: hypothetical protein OJF51_000289 [Nitrospira sp.]